MKMEMGKKKRWKKSAMTARVAARGKVERVMSLSKLIQHDHDERPNDGPAHRMTPNLLPYLPPLFDRWMTQVASQTLDRFLGTMMVEIRMTTANT
jgi:hypothetical protein